MIDCRPLIPHFPVAIPDLPEVERADVPSKKIKNRAASQKEVTSPDLPEVETNWGRPVLLNVLAFIFELTTINPSLPP